MDEDLKQRLLTLPYGSKALLDAVEEALDLCIPLHIIEQLTERPEDNPHIKANKRWGWPPWKFKAIIKEAKKYVQPRGKRCMIPKSGKRNDRHRKGDPEEMKE